MSSNIPTEVIIHPVALFCIVDSYERRNEDAKRVIGTLLGSIDKGVVEVRNCFTVPHHETEEEAAMEIDYASSMFKLHQKASPNDQIVGWYATCADVTEHSVLIHDYYSRETDNPIHVTVDTTFRQGKMAVKAYLSSPMGVPGGTMGCIFTPVPCNVTFFEPEAVAFDTFTKNKGGSKKPMQLLSSVQHIAKSADNLVERLGMILSYVDDVLDGKVTADNEIGRFLMDVVNSVPDMDASQLEAALNSSMQDLLVVLYLANLTKTQLPIGTKLNGVVSI